ncbi:hypothetical protein J2Z31_003598 [Sinorhizobium kostiense]|uniref:Uncharacterized protein n=1 Tax=Sinorhizobium kostiense TaxID=76747 RepID=A0ABS4R2H9_9HYPH|nr:hypothetical protein [Sinorhizobium kostiense]
MPDLDARHILVHRDGKADAVYREAYPDVALENQGKIKLDFMFVNSARTSVCEPANQSDQQIIATNVVAQNDVVH